MEPFLSFSIESRSREASSLDQHIRPPRRVVMIGRHTLLDVVVTHVGAIVALALVLTGCRLSTNAPGHIADLGADRVLVFGAVRQVDHSGAPVSQRFLVSPVVKIDNLTQGEELGFHDLGGDESFYWRLRPGAYGIMEYRLVFRNPFGGSSWVSCTTRGFFTVHPDDRILYVGTLEVVTGTGKGCRVRVLDEYPTAVIALRKKFPDVPETTKRLMAIG